MRTTGFLFCCCAIAAVLWMAAHGRSSPEPESDAGGIRSHAVHALLGNEFEAREPQFLIISPVPATLAEGTPPT